MVTICSLRLGAGPSVTESLTDAIFWRVRAAQSGRKVADVSKLRVVVYFMHTLLLLVGRSLLVVRAPHRCSMSTVERKWAAPARQSAL